MLQEKVDLGATGLRVSRLGFGTFDFGDPFLHIRAEEGGLTLRKAYELGINYWDTSNDYGSHHHIASALKLLPTRSRHFDQDVRYEG